MKLIADSGSTKTDWALMRGRGVASRCSTQGINPFQQDADAIKAVLSDELLPQLCADEPVTEVFFYGAGCRDEVCGMMAGIIREVFPLAVTVEVNSDLLAAARALCGREAGVACILGTGANSCLYDGEHIAANVPPLGYILGDEGSGAVLGRNLVNALYKGRLPEPLLEAFTAETALSLSDIINKVYRQPMANRFLASFSLFVGRHIDEYEELRDLVIDNFRAFFRNNVSRYRNNSFIQSSTLEISAVGSLACRYEKELRAAAAVEGFKVGAVARSPMDGLVSFHKKDASSE